MNETPKQVTDDLAALPVHVDSEGWRTVIVPSELFDETLRQFQALQAALGESLDGWVAAFAGNDPNDPVNIRIAELRKLT